MLIFPFVYSGPSVNSSQALHSTASYTANVSPFSQSTLCVTMEKGLGVARFTPHGTQSVSSTDQLCSLKPYKSAAVQ